MKFWRRVKQAVGCGLWAVGPATALLAVVLSAQTVTTGDPMHLRLRALGEKLKCQCSCAYTVGSCNMLNCHFREEINEQVKADLNASVDENTIITKLKQKYGIHILAAPPAEGFNLVGWIMPFFALAAGLFVIRYVLVRWRKARPAPAVSAASVDRYRDQIEKELADLE